VQPITTQKCEDAGKLLGCALKHDDWHSAAVLAESDSSARVRRAALASSLASALDEPTENFFAPDSIGRF
jgi:hypothetical protein